MLSLDSIKIQEILRELENADVEEIRKTISRVRYVFKGLKP